MLPQVFKDEGFDYVAFTDKAEKIIKKYQNAEE